MSKQLTAKAEAGKRGGMKRVPKGFAKKSDAEKSKAAMKGNWSRWGQKATIELEVAFLPGHKARLIEAAKLIMSEWKPVMQPHDVGDAIGTLIEEFVLVEMKKRFGIEFLSSTTALVPLTDWDKERFGYMDRDESEEKAQAEAPITVTATEVVQ